MDGRIFLIEITLEDRQKMAKGGIRVAKTVTMRLIFTIGLSTYVSFILKTEKYC